MVPCEYVLRLSRKAKYLQLRVSPQGLEVIVPAKREPSKEIIYAFIQEKSLWIQKRLSEFTAPKKEHEWPQCIHFPPWDDVWNIFYIPTLSKKIQINVNLDKQIKLTGDIKNRALCLRVLYRWLKQTAEKYLGHELRVLADETGLSFGKLTIRNNTTRWGSCSAAQNINLCYRLLFLPRPLMQHVLLHELCHTKIMNHGPSFWRLLEKYDAEANRHAQALRKGATYVPGWVNDLNLK